MQDATRINGFLAIIVRLTGYELLLGVCVVFLRIALATRRFRKGEISPANRHRFELELQDLLRELGRRIMPWAVNSLEPADRFERPGQLLWKGEYYRQGATCRPCGI